MSNTDKELTPTQARALLRDLLPILKQLLRGAKSIDQVLNPFRKPGTSKQVPLRARPAAPNQPVWVKTPIKIEVLHTSAQQLGREIKIKQKVAHGDGTLVHLALEKPERETGDDA